MKLDSDIKSEQTQTVWFQIWHEQLCEFSLESSELKLSFGKMNSNAKFEQTLPFWFKKCTKNCVNFHYSTQKSEK